LVGRSPLLMENVTPGPLSISLQLDGYEPWTSDAVIQPGEMTRLSSTMQRQTGNLTLVSAQTGVSAEIFDQSGAKVFQGELPVHKQVLDVGTYEISFTKDKFIPLRKKIQMKPGYEIRLEDTLERKPGRVQIAHSGREPMEVFVDGKYLGKAGGGIAVDLPEGRHELALRTFQGEKILQIDVVADEVLEIPASVLEVDRRISLWGALGAMLFTGAVVFASEVAE
ncbi:MAG TPA: PEGA domain-containing protein, partial [Fibrobacteraceae bacterium]|nr:PEGA domain-containing protein [Fibrobacteraceae bacterium]